MDKFQFLNRIHSGCNQAQDWELEQYFNDYAGPYDENTADGYVCYFSNDPKELLRNAHQGENHRKSLIENGLLQINSPVE